MKFAAKLDQLSVMLEWLRSQRIDSKMELACEEALVNVIVHAYKGKEGMVEITVEKIPHDRLVVTIKDQGPPFNPLDHRLKELLPLEEQPEGGLGIHLIRSCVDQVLYERDASLNVLTLIRFFRTE